MKTLVIIAGVVLVVFAVIIVVVLIFVDPQLPFLQKAAYLSVNLLSVLACGMLIAITAVFAALAALVNVLKNLSRDKVGPLIDKVNNTTDTVRGTVAYVGEGVVSPLVRLAALLAGLRAAVGALFPIGRRGEK